MPLGEEGSALVFEHALDLIMQLYGFLVGGKEVVVHLLLHFVVRHDVIDTGLLVSKLFKDELVVSGEDLLRFLLRSRNYLVHDLVKTLLHSLLDAVVLLYHSLALLFSHDSVRFVDFVEEQLRFIPGVLIKAETFRLQVSQSDLKLFDEGASGLLY